MNTPPLFRDGVQMRKKLTNTVIAKLAVPEGKQSVKLFDTDVGGLGVRKMASGVATFIFEMRPKGAGAMKQVKIGRCGDMSVDQARARARELALDYTSPDFLQTEAARGQTPTPTRPTTRRTAHQRRRRGARCRPKRPFSTRSARCTRWAAPLSCPPPSSSALRPHPPLPP